MIGKNLTAVLEIFIANFFFFGAKDLFDQIRCLSWDTH